MSLTNDFVLKKNDRVVFLGDSITEQQLYTNYVETYLATRFPELNLTFFNAGWGGDTAPGGVERLDRDVLALKPTVVTLCYGMNDGGYTPPTDEIRNRFVNGMRELVARLKAAHVRVVLLTPGMVDEGANPAMGTVRYNHGGLRVLADEVLRLATTEQLPVFDLHRLMNEIDAKAKAADPKFCMIPDSVHPDPAGHLVMAFGLLQALGIPPLQQSIEVDAAAGKASATPGVVARAKRQRGGTLQLSLKLDRLPFFVEMAARKVLPFLPFQEHFNSCSIRFRGLTASRAWLRMGNTGVYSFRSEDLNTGINFFDQWSSGPMQIAGAIHRFTCEKDQVYFKIWRSLSLNNEKAGPHHAGAHASGIRLMPGLERVRKSMLTRTALACSMELVATDKIGVPSGNGDFIGRWSSVGPFPKPFATDRLGGEAAFTEQIPAMGSWVPCDLDLSNPGNNLVQSFGQMNDCFVYLAAVIDSPVAQTAELLVGSDDGLAVWLNGEQYLSQLEVARGVTVDQDRMPVSLRAGNNLLLLKVTQYGGGWGVCARFAGLSVPVTVRNLSDR